MSSNTSQFTFDGPDWGWRVPFVPGTAIIGIFGFWLRRSVGESPRGAVHVEKSMSSPIQIVWRGHRRNLIRTFGVASRDALSYNFAVTVFGGFAPFVATWLISMTGNPLSPTWYIATGALISLVAARLSRETAQTVLR
ncbi:hypothetical protein [Paraburkholderia agricolaris]|uniref:hypothetical protein n=1 Tax=Paraburkholderia agricolaris TaxID=2152888 RepID=UPI001291AF8A|nr:hypothetical protein [Paraburkholderia agricolaris]